MSGKIVFFINWFVIDIILSYEKREPIKRRDEITKLFLYLLNNESNIKVLEKGEIAKLKKLFYAFNKNIIA